MKTNLKIIKHFFYNLLFLIIFPITSFSNSDINREALKKALQDEYKSYATYEQALKDFGNIRPFINIVQAEKRHIEALIPFFEQYHEPIPENLYLGNISSFSSMREACAQGVLKEMENIVLYDELLEMIDDEALKQTFLYLRSASENNHLPAFRRCLSRLASGY